MLGGDLDNTPSPRWLITLDALTGGGKTPPKKWRKTWKDIAEATPIERLMLGRLWAFTDRIPVRFELVLFEVDEDYRLALEKHLDDLGVHPIAWVTAYEDRKALQQELAYRPDVQGVVDTREGVLWWGARGREVMSLLEVRHR